MSGKDLLYEAIMIQTKLELENTFSSIKDCIKHIARKNEVSEGSILNANLISEKLLIGSWRN